MGLQVAITRIFLLIILFVWIRDTQCQLKVFNVMNYGAIANGEFDNSKVMTIEKMLFQIFMFRSILLLNCNHFCVFGRHWGEHGMRHVIGKEPV